MSNFVYLADLIGASAFYPDLTGGGLLRSIGGWTVLKGLRKAGIRVKGDERILGDSDFVKNVLESTIDC